MTLAIAHRGDHTEHLENTIETFESAAAPGIYAPLLRTVRACSIA